VLPGGPEQIAAHPGRALVLMWPDYLGRGAFGTECLEAFDGDTLVLVGEWQVRAHTHMRMHTHTHEHEHTRTRTCACTRTRTSTSTRARARARGGGAGRA